MASLIYHYNLENLSKQVIKLREEKGLSQRKLAELLGYTRTTIRNLETKKNYNPSANLLIDLCTFFGCDMEHLFGERDYSDLQKEEICEYTGLNESAINLLHSSLGFVLLRDVINTLLTQPYIFSLIDRYGRWDAEPVVLELSDGSGKAVRVSRSGLVSTWDYNKNLPEQFESNWDSHIMIPQVVEYLDTSNLHGETYVGEFPISEMAFKNAMLDLIGKKIEEIYKKQEEPKTSAAKGKKKKKKE